jgi:hypothetical protein
MTSLVFLTNLKNILDHLKYGKDLHTPGAPLPLAIFHNSIGYMPDGTPTHMAGNELNHPENLKPDAHTPGSPLIPSAYAADVGYFVDGTPVDKAGNIGNHA